jgi:hypothetical protein
VQGGLTSVQGLASIAGYLLGGYVFRWSLDPANEAPPGTVYFVSALLCAAGLGLAVWNLQPTAPGLPANDR